MTQRMAERTTPDEPVPPVNQRPRAEMSDATRHLCVGAYLDDYFRDRCLREVYYQKRRFVAPSYGFDLVVVLDQCLGARNLMIWREAAIVIACVAAAYLNWLSVVALAAALICMRTTRAAGGLARDFIGRVRAGTAVDTTKSPRRALTLLLAWSGMWLVFVAVASKVVSSVTASFVGGAGSARPHLPLGNGAALLLALIVLALPVTFALWREKRIERFSVGSLSPPVRMTRRMLEVDRQQRGNTVVYSGFEPFVGSGDVMSTWGFAHRLVRKPPDTVDRLVRSPTEGEREFPQPPFRALELVAYLRSHLIALASDGSAEERIPDMTVEDRVFLSGREFGERRLDTSQERMAEIIRNPTMPARHYLTCQVISWRGELVTTVHIHVAIQGRGLYLEVTTTCLAPCNERYRIVDMDGGTGFTAWLRAARNGIRDTPNTIVRAPGRLVRSLVGLAAAPGAAARVGLSHRRFDYGTRTSVREIGTKDKLRNFTQRQDILKFKRLIERRVIALVLDFLDERDVDTTEYRASAASVLNIGIGHFGSGDMTFQDKATGQRITPANQPSPPPEG